ANVIAEWSWLRQGRQLLGLLLNSPCQLLFVSKQLLRNRGISEPNHLRGKNASVRSAWLANSDGRHRNASRHLHSCKKRIHTLKRCGRNRNTDDGNRGVSGNHSGQMRCTTSSSDDDANAPVDGLAHEIGSAVRRTVRRGDVDFVSNAEFLQRLARLAHNLKVGITAHHDGN